MNEALNEWLDKTDWVQKDAHPTELGYCGELIAPDGTTVAMFAEEPSPMDACLIAAAPELLAELIEAADFIESMGMDATPARAAIAKATGGTK